LGDLVRERSDVMRRKPHKNWEFRFGVIIDVDPLRREIRHHERHNDKWVDDYSEEIVEIVVLLPDGTLWHAAPRHWEVIDESR